MPVDYGGQSAEIIEINEIAAKHDLVVIEDAAQALGGKYNGLHAINLTFKFRITLIIKFENKSIILVDIGGHDEVYR